MTNLSVTNRFVGHGELAQVVADHVSLDFDGVPVLARVDLGHRADHLGHNDAVSQMGLHSLGFLAIGRVLHSLGQLLDQAFVAGGHTSAESSLLARAEHAHNLLGRELEELVKFDTSVNLLFECLFGLIFGGRHGLSKSLLNVRHI